ncbi:MAG TPA: PIN domain-containing protein [Opitutaceae bacterium]|nr:PIN domain-containing protein [Opitutaceae bacterium]
MPDAPTHFVFVDFENVPEVDLAAIAGRAVHVTLLLGNKQKKLDLELVKQIKAFHAQVDLVEVGGSGRNALDLTLACYLGRAIERAPAAGFAIVSKDKDFAPMIAHLVTQKIEVARYDSFAALPFLPHRKPVVVAKMMGAPKIGSAAKKPAEPRRAKSPSRPPFVPAETTPPLPVDRLEKLVVRLRNHAEPHPKTKPKLLAKINTDFGNKLDEAACVAKLEELIKRGIVEIDGNDRVSYPTMTDGNL